MGKLIVFNKDGSVTIPVRVVKEGSVIQRLTAAEIAKFSSPVVPAAKTSFVDETNKRIAALPSDIRRRLIHG